VIQQIKADSLAEKDGRLQPGDHILSVNFLDSFKMTMFNC